MAAPGKCVLSLQNYPGIFCQRPAGFHWATCRIPLKSRKNLSESPFIQTRRSVGNLGAKSVSLLRWGGLDAVAKSLFHEGSSAKPPSSTHSQDCGRFRGVPASVHAEFVTFNRVSIVRRG